MNLYLIGAAVITAGGIVSFAVNEKHKPMAVTLFSVSGAFVIFFSCAGVFQSGAVTGHTYFRLDGLSAFFAVLTALSGIFACAYSGPYMKKYFGRGLGTASHFFLLPVLISSMLMVVVSSHAVSFLFFWEIMALSSFFLAAFENSKKDVFEASIYYLVMSHISGALLVAGFLLASGNSLSFDSFAAFLNGKTALSAGVFALLFAGFGIKAGIAPLHTWLPAAHPAAPSHISGLMSGVMIKTGIYGMIRLLYILPPQGMYAAYTVSAIGLFTAVFAGIYTMTQRDYKRVLAYSSIENIGIITTGIGVSMAGAALNLPSVAVLALAGSLVHSFNHSLIKSMLFFASGEVYSSVHTRDMEHLGGLGKKLPFTAVSFLTGSAAASGVPALNGLPGKLLIYLALISAAMSGNPAIAPAAVIAMAALALAGASALIGFVRTYGVVFSGTARSDTARNASPENRGAAALLALMAVLCFMSGIFPRPLIAFSAAALGNAPAAEMSGVLNQLTAVSAAMILITVIIYFALRFGLAKKTRTAPVWGCGYGGASPRMQYTAYSFSEPFLKTAGPVLYKHKEEKTDKSIYPVPGSYSAKYSDTAEKNIIIPAAGAVETFLKKFSWIQSGNTQRYIIYGLLFLLVSLVWAVLI